MRAVPTVPAGTMNKAKSKGGVKASTVYSGYKNVYFQYWGKVQVGMRACMHRLD